MLAAAGGEAAVGYDVWDFPRRNKRNFFDELQAMVGERRPDVLPRSDGLRSRADEREAADEVREAAYGGDDVER